MAGWIFRPGETSQVELVERAGGKAIRLRPAGRTLGVETERLPVGARIQASQAYRAAALLKHDGLEKGVFAFSMYCFDGQGKSLKQIVFASRGKGSAAHDWRLVRGEFGPGTRNPLPEGTKTVSLRFSFHEPAGDCRGTMTVDEVSLTPFQPAPVGWPAEIVADVGPLQVRFESRSFWTLYRVDYEGVRLCIDQWGAHYGSVVSFPGVGFIGSGHTENEDEEVLDLKLLVDGQAVERPQATVACRSIQLQKKSRIRTLILQTEVLVGDGRIVEDVRLLADRATPVALVYHFMHPWTPTATEYLAELPDGRRLEGAFDGDRTQKIDQPVRWSAIFDGPSAKGAVTCVLAAPSGDAWRTRYWDVPQRYRKHYLATFLGKTIPAGETFHYRAATLPFAADPARWKAEAARLAATCR